MTVAVVRGDARRLPLPDGCVDLVVTSPPYFCLRDYGYAGQIGSEGTPGEWLAALLECTAEWVRVLKPEGSIFVNLGDRYVSSPPGNERSLANSPEHQRKQKAAYDRVWRNPTDWPQKCLMGLPWRYALGCVDQLGLILRAEIIWSKPNGLPESVTDRVRRAHEQVFHLVRQPRYYAAVDEIREPHTGPSPDHYGRINYERAPDPAGMARTKAPAPPGTARQYNPLGKLPGSVWEIPSAPLVVPPSLGIDHFAAFPPALVRPIVLGWSPPGVCTGCGQGRRRPQVLRELGPDHQGRIGTLHGGDRARLGHATERKMLDGLSLRTITGYACACPQPDAPTRPAIVLDPFGGTGTTALVASVYGRHGISVDLSADYTRLARWRTTDPGERARAMQVPKPPPVPDGQDALFALESP